MEKLERSKPKLRMVPKVEFIAHRSVGGGVGGRRQAARQQQEKPTCTQHCSQQPGPCA